MDNYVIVSGPAVATSVSQYQYIALLDTVSGDTVAVLKIDRKSQIKTLKITSVLDSATEMYALLNFVVTLATQYRGQYLSLIDGDATSFADLVTFSQSLAEFKAMLARLSIVVEASVQAEATNGKVNSLRLTDDNVTGLSQIKTASSIVMTIKAA